MIAGLVPGITKSRLDAVAIPWCKKPLVEDEPDAGFYTEWKLEVRGAKQIVLQYGLGDLEGSAFFKKRMGKNEYRQRHDQGTVHVAGFPVAEKVGDKGLAYAGVDLCSVATR